MAEGPRTPRSAFEDAVDAGEYVTAVELIRSVRADGTSSLVELASSAFTADELEEMADADSVGDALFALGAFLWNGDGRELHAIDVFIEAAGRGSAEAVAAAGESLEWMGAAREARPWLERAVADPSTRTPRLDGLLGLVLRAEDETSPDVIPLLRSGFSADDYFGVPLAQVLRERGRFEEARDILEGLVDRGRSGAAIVLGNLRQDDLDDLEGAEDAYRKGIDADDAHSAFNLGLLLRRMGRGEEAEEAFRLALRMGDLTDPGGP